MQGPRYVGTKPIAPKDPRTAEVLARVNGKMKVGLFRRLMNRIFPQRTKGVYKINRTKTSGPMNKVLMSMRRGKR
jgi:hypothetical protein